MAKKDYKSSTRQQFFIDGVKREWQFPTGNKKKAAFAKQMVNRLAEARKTNFPDAEATAWALELDDRMYEKLVLWNLVEPKERRWTLGDLLARFMESQANAEKASFNKFIQVRANLLAYFSESRELATITYDHAEKFRKWLETEPLNKRGKKEAVPYSEATVNRRTNIVKQIFSYGIRIGMLTRSPMEFLQGGESVNEERWEYVAVERVLKVIAECPNASTRTIIALIRFCGLRGASELFSLTWKDIEWSTGDNPCRILVRGTKNRRHQKGTRWVPAIHPVVEQCLANLFELTPENQPRLFPDMTAHSNPGVVVEKAMLRTPDILPWKVPLYNLRKSFCCDMFGLISDPKFYEYVCDHSYTVAMRHYQILHPDRLQKGFDSLKMQFNPPQNTPDSPPNASDSLIIPQEEPALSETKIIKHSKTASPPTFSVPEKLPQNLPQSRPLFPQNLPQQILYIYCRKLQQVSSNAENTDISSTSGLKKEILAVACEDDDWATRASNQERQNP